MADEIEQVVSRFIGDLGDTVRNLARSLQGPQRTPETVLELGGRLQRIFDLTQERMAGLFPPAEPVACKAGCTYCCHLLFFTDVLTVFLVADWLRRNRPADALERLQSRLAAFIDDGYGLKTVPRPPCPLLADDRCMAYDVRPLVCRAQNSLQVSQCEEKFHGKRDMVVAYDVPLRIWTALAEGLSAGLAEAGLAGSESVEFVTALKIVLETPDAMERWIAGEPVFAPAQWTDTSAARSPGRPN
jgi:hypothetical protein